MRGGEREGSKERRERGEEMTVSHPRDVSQRRQSNLYYRR